MKLIVWKIECIHDSDCYSIRARTKKEAIASVIERGAADYVQPYGKNAGKVEILRREYEFSSLFDLYDSVQSEDRGMSALVSCHVTALPLSRFL